MTSAHVEGREMLIGVISDTHGHFPAGVVDAFGDVDLVIHAGDFNTPEVYHSFQKLGPLKAVRGNTDHAPLLRQLPTTEVVQAAGVFIFVIHDLLEMQVDPDAAGFQVVIHGHQHVQEVRRRNGVLYLNPGSPNSPRGGSRPGAALLKVRAGQAEAELLSFR